MLSFWIDLRKHRELLTLVVRRKILTPRRGDAMSFSHRVLKQMRPLITFSFVSRRKLVHSRFDIFPKSKPVDAVVFGLPLNELSLFSCLSWFFNWLRLCLAGVYTFFRGNECPAIFTQHFIDQILLIGRCLFGKFQEHLLLLPGFPVVPAEFTKHVAAFFEVQQRR